MKPTALIVRVAGTNCDRELAYAFEAAGAVAQTVHLHQLIEQPERIARADLIGFPGGFSYGDDIAAGRIFANRLRHRLLGPLQAAVQRGTPIIGICNGFQVLVKLGLLPDPSEAQSGQTATLADNESGRFIDRWVSLNPVSASVCLWTRGLPDPFDLPIAHGEGRFVPASDQALERLRTGGQIALRYATGPGTAFPGNPNGSVDGIAGVCDPTGVVLGLMPHPERHVRATQHPLWTRRETGTGVVSEKAPVPLSPPGLRFFQNAVEHVCARAPQPVGS